MVFLHPWLLALGVAGLGLPILVHWLTRPRPRRLPLSTLRFVREAVHQRRAIHRLRDYIILGLRVLAVAMLAWAFSRPLIGGGQIWDTTDAGDAARVVIVDASHSMSAVWRGVEAFERARSLAAEHLAGRAGLRADVIFAAAQPRRVFDGLSANFADLRNELSQARPRPERCDTAKALLAAADILGKAPADKDHRRELVIITDLQQSNWGAADFSVLPSDTVIQIESVAAEQTPSNVAIVRVGCAGRAELGRQTRVEVEVANYSPTPRDVPVELTVGTSVQRLDGVCPAGKTVVLSKDVTLREGGWIAGEARLVGVEDAIAADNRRAFVVDVRPQATYALLTREDAARRPSSSYYLERALAPRAAGAIPAHDRDAVSISKEATTVVRVAPTQVNRESLSPADVMVIDRPGQLAADAVSLLVAVMRRGKPVVYVASEAVDASNLKLISQAAGPDLHLPVEFVPPVARASRRNLSLAEYRRDLTPFNVFGDRVTAAIEPLRFTRGLDSRDVAGGLRDDVLARYNDKTAGLVWSTCGTGALVVLNADLAESNLAQSTAFVPLMGELTAALLNGRTSARVINCGEPMTAYLPADAGAAASLRIQGSLQDGADTGELAEEPAGVVWRWPSAGPPGVYEVMRDARPVMAVATGVPAEESDLKPLSADAVREHAAGGRTIHYRAATSREQQQDDVWTWIGVACVAFMLAELVALRAFRT
jgi:hypothetical protein